MVHTKVDVTETATTNFAADSVLVADAEVLLGGQPGALQRCTCRDMVMMMVMAMTRSSGGSIPLSSWWEDVQP